MKALRIVKLQYDADSVFIGGDDDVVWTLT
jgi:hypothetical protein